MQIHRDGEQTFVRRGLGADFEVGPIGNAGTDCNYHTRCGRPAVYTVPHKQAGSILERHCCREHLYRWAYMDDMPLVERVKRHVDGIDDPCHYWRPVQLTNDDVPDTYPINGVNCVAVGLDQMQRVHYISPTLNTALIGVIEEGEFRHDRDPLKLRKNTVEDYIDLVAEKGPDWYARCAAEKVRARARGIEPQYHQDESESGETIS